MSRISFIYVLMLGSLLQAACSSKLDFAAEVISPKTFVETITIGDEDFALVTYRTDDAENPHTVFYVGGSGCTSLRAYMGTYFAKASPSLEIVALEKTGVQDRAIGNRCAQSFWENYTYDELIRRNEIALSHLMTVRGLTTIPIMGTSEGGAIALELAARTNTAQSIAILGAGAMPQRQELQNLYGADAANRALERVANNPQSIEERVFGLPHRYWASVLDRDPSRYLSQIEAPTLILIGEEDQNVPVTSARIADNLIKNSQLIIWPAASHTFDTPNGNQRDEVVQTATAFLTRE